MGTSLNYNSLTAGVVKYLKANTATIDAQMYASVSTIAEFRPEDYSVYGSKFPAISVDLISHEEERIELGLGANDRPQVTCTFQIGCHIRNFASYTAAYQSMRTLVSNVENALRADDTLSGTFSVVNITGAEFGNIIRANPGNIQKNGIISLETINYIA